MIMILIMIKINDTNNNNGDKIIYKKKEEESQCNIVVCM